jgi:hypothetical protein
VRADDHPPDFYMASSEGYGLEEPRACYRVKRLEGRGSDAYLLVRVEPAISALLDGLAEVEMDHVVLATRHAGQSLFPVSEWPLSVHVARCAATMHAKETLAPEDLELIAWAELYPTEIEARRG